MTIPFNEEMFIIEATRLNKIISTLLRLYGSKAEPYMHHHLTTIRGELKSAINFMFEERTAHTKTADEKVALMFDELSPAAQKHARVAVLEINKDIKPKSPKVSTLCRTYGYKPDGSIVGLLFVDKTKGE